MNGWLILAGIVIIGFIAFLFRPRRSTQAVRKRRSAARRKAQQHRTPELKAAPEDDMCLDTAAQEFAPQAQEEDYLGDDIISVRYNVNSTDTYEDVQADPAAATKVVSFYLLAENNAPYQGYELLQSLLSAGLRFGKQQIFHYLKKHAGRNVEVFSCASVEDPGTFDIQHMGGCTCKGLVLFFTATVGTSKALHDFDTLIDTLGQLHDSLGGDVCDQSGTPITQQMLQEMRDSLTANSVNDDESCYAE